MLLFYKVQSVSVRSIMELVARKQEMLFQIYTMTRFGYESNQIVTIDNSLEEMENEFQRLKILFQNDSRERNELTRQEQEFQNLLLSLD